MHRERWSHYGGTDQPSDVTWTSIRAYRIDANFTDKSRLQDHDHYIDHGHDIKGSLRCHAIGRDPAAGDWRGG